MKGIIFDIDHFATHDGPGIRTVIFLKGCPLTCAWCHSPESQEFGPELLYMSSKCISCGICGQSRQHQTRSSSQHRTQVLERSRREQSDTCITACPQSAIKLSGELKEVDAVVAQAAAYRVFYEHSGGGVTISGGEPLAQPAFTLEIAKRLRLEGIHTILETSGMGKWTDLNSLIPYIDHFYYDLKLFDSSRHLKHTGVLPNVIQSNLENLSRQTRQIAIRLPLIPGYTDDEDNVSEIYHFIQRLGLKQIHLLPYNASSEAKYAWLGRDYSPGHLPKQTPEKLLSLASLAPEGLEVSIMTS